MRAHRRSSQYAYGVAPVIHHKRSIFNLSHKNLFSTSMGRLTPCLVEEVYPGDDFTIKATMVARVTTALLRPVMDNLFADLYFFYVPSRILYDEFESVFGQAKPSQYTSPEYSSVPMINSGSAAVNSIADYMGIPVDTPLSSELSISVLPFRAYAKIYNDWFRDENLVDEVNVQTGALANSEKLNIASFGAGNYTGLCANVAKTHDYFTQLLIAPQKGLPVEIGTSVYQGGQYPVYTKGTPNPVPGGGTFPLSFWTSGWNGTGSELSQSTKFTPYTAMSPATSASPFSLYREVGWQYAMGAASDSASTSPSSEYYNVSPANLSVTIPTQAISSANVNDLRFAFQLQRLLELDARSGSRYIEILRSEFGVSSPDARLQRSEYLGGRRIPINVQQVTQTSYPVQGDSPLGSVAAFSLTGGQSSTVKKGFVEHGYIIGLVAFRQFHTYQQGIRPMWRRQVRNDFYTPVFANIGEQPVYLSELYAAGSNASTTVFGYKPPWEELRTSPNMVCGQMRSDGGEGLDIWHFADVYAEAPVLGKQWIEETPSNVDRTLAAPSTTVDQFIVDMWFDEKAVRVLPTYGVPGLIDHH